LFKNKTISTLRYITNTFPNGFGYAVRKGPGNFSGDCIALMIADLSDSPEDLFKFYHTMVQSDYYCVFGSCFIKWGKTQNYPKFQKIINRIADFIIKVAFRIGYNDTTNAFKLLCQ